MSLPEYLDFMFCDARSPIRRVEIQNRFSITYVNQSLVFEDSVNNEERFATAWLTNHWFCKLRYSCTATNVSHKKDLRNSSVVATTVAAPVPPCILPRWRTSGTELNKQWNMKVVKWDLPWFECTFVQYDVGFSTTSWGTLITQDTEGAHFSSWAVPDHSFGFSVESKMVRTNLSSVTNLHGSKSELYLSSNLIIN